MEESPIGLSLSKSTLLVNQSQLGLTQPSNGQKRKKELIASEGKHHDQNTSWNNAPILSHDYSCINVHPQTTTFNNAKFEVGEPSNRNNINPHVS